MTDQERIQALKDLDASDASAKTFIQIYTDTLTSNERQRAELTADLSPEFAQACEIVGVKLADKKATDAAKLARAEKAAVAVEVEK
jgi:hypothetical protein